MKRVETTRSVPSDAINSRTVVSLAERRRARARSERNLFLTRSRVRTLIGATVGATALVVAGITMLRSFLPNEKKNEESEIAKKPEKPENWLLGFLTELENRPPYFIVEIDLRDGRTIRSTRIEIDDINALMPFPERVDTMRVVFPNGERFEQKF